MTLAKEQGPWRAHKESAVLGDDDAPWIESSTSDNPFERAKASGWQKRGLSAIQPRVLLESGSPQASIALAAIGYGVAIVPSTVLLPRERVRGIPLTQRGAAIGRWLRLVWEPQRFLAAYAETFANDLIDYCRRNYPGHEFSRRAPQLPRPRDRLGKSGDAELYEPRNQSIR